MNKRVSIFVGAVLLGFCQSATPMGLHLRYRKKLSAAPFVRAALCRKRCNLSIYPPVLFMHMSVQADKATKHNEELKVYLRKLWFDQRGEEECTSIHRDDSEKFYHHVVSCLPWNGEHKKGSYPLLLNEREVTIQAYCKPSEVDSFYWAHLFTKTDLLKDVEHHEKVCQQFKKLIELPIADSFQIHQREYDEIKNAVFAKKGKGYAELFDMLYPHATQESVITLSKEFDEGSCHTWKECYPPRSHAYINGQKFGIDGKIGAIIYDNQNS